MTHPSGAIAGDGAVPEDSTSRIASCTAARCASGASHAPAAAIQRWVRATSVANVAYRDTSPTSSGYLHASGMRTAARGASNGAAGELHGHTGDHDDEDDGELADDEVEDATS